MGSAKILKPSIWTRTLACPSHVTWILSEGGDDKTVLSRVRTGRFCSSSCLKNVEMKQKEISDNNNNDKNDTNDYDNKKISIVWLKEISVLIKPLSTLFQFKVVLNPLTPRSDSYVTSPYNIHTLSSKNVMRILELIR